MQTAILCRTNAPLVKCAFDLIRKGRGVKIKIIGRDIAKVLKDLVGEVLDYRRNCGIDEFKILLDGWINAIRISCEDEESDKSEEYLAECEDQYGCLVTIADQAEDAKGVLDIIDSYFSDGEELEDDENTVILASGHRSKGLEFDRVIWIRPDLCPHPSAETEADRAQEEHLLYILATRAKRELWICNDSRPA